MARPSLYKNPETLEKTKEYIDECKDVVVDGKTVSVKIPTIEGLAVFLDVNKDTIYEWRKVHDEFSDLIGMLLANQADKLVNNGLAGRYNPTITKVLLTKHGYREGVDATTNDKDLPPIYLPAELIKKNNLDGTASSSVEDSK